MPVVIEQQIVKGSRLGKVLLADRLSLALAGVLCLAVLLTFQQYGVTWDEPAQNRYGSLINRFYINLLHGHYDIGPIRNHLDLYLYGGAFDSVATALEHVSPFGEFETRHLLNAIVGLLGILGAWKTGRLLGGPWAAFWTAVLLALTPHYYGHMFNNPKDIPFAVGFIWSIYYMLRAIPYLPRIPVDICLKLACAIGFSMSVRVGGLLLLCYAAMLLGLSFLSRRTVPALLDAMRSFTWIAVSAWCVMLLFWPWAQGSPLARPLQAFRYFQTLPTFSGDARWVLYEGLVVDAARLPRTYTLHWFAISLPELILALAAGGAVWALVSALRRKISASEAFLAFAVCFPLAFVTWSKPVLYDAERHSIYMIPPVAVACALVYTRASAWIRARSSALALAFLVVICGYLAYHISVMARMHPYEYVYFNRIAGGLRGADRQYDTDYWCTSYREAVAVLVNRVAPEIRESGPRSYKIYMVSTQRVAATYYFPSYFSLTTNLEDADFFLSTTKNNLDQSVDGCPAGVVERFGVPLAVIKDRRCLKRS